MVLRTGPAALPASDPLVTRLAALLGNGLADDVHELVSRAALLVQRIGEAAEIDLLTSTLEPLIGHIEAHVATIRRLDQDLAELDEGRLVRAIATCEARGAEPSERDRFSQGLDRLRELEVERARALSGLAEACDLARRSIELGLEVQDPAAEHERRIKMAMSALASSEA